MYIRISSRKVQLLRTFEICNTLKMVSSGKTDPQGLKETLKRSKDFRIDLWVRLLRYHLKHRVETQHEESRGSPQRQAYTLQAKEICMYGDVWKHSRKNTRFRECRGLQYMKNRGQCFRLKDVSFDLWRMSQILCQKLNPASRKQGSL